MPTTFEEAYSYLNTAQKQAVDTIDGPVLVIAGPGTGKTQLLTMRIANILQKTDTLPENILCLTFTDSAATTMRERLSGIIGKAAYDITISTYHAFGSELIRRYPEYFMASADLRPVDDLTIDATLRDIFSRLPYSNPLRHDIFLRDVKSFISDAKRALLEPEDIRKVADANEHFINDATKLVRTYLDGLNRIDKKSAALFEKLLAASDKLSTAQPAANVVSLHTLWQQELAAALEYFHNTSKTSELTRWKNTWLMKDEAGAFIAGGGEQVRKLRAVAAIYERYLTELARLGLYDYDDMILHAIRGLQEHADLRFTLQERYLYVLLDEFQDTNEAQSRLVELMTDSPVNEGRPNVLAVGDDDQAIYAFQGANYSHMLNFYERYRDVLVIPLTENYRSHTEILQLASGVAAQIETRLHQYFPTIDKNITAASEDLPDHSALGRYEFRSDLSQNTWVAKRIKQLIGQGIPPSEIAVLAPKHEYLEALVPFLHHQEVAIHYDKRENVLDDAIVRELVTMSRLALALAVRDQARSDSLWPEVLSFNFWNISTEQLWKLSWEAHDNRKAWVDVLCEREGLKPIALYFIRLSQLVNSESLEQLLDYLIGTSELHINGSGDYRSPFYAHYFGELQYETDNTADLWQVLSNLTVIRQHLREYRANDLAPLMLADFIEFIEAHQAADIKILNTNPYQEATDAVELMTVYKSKGREFQAVFLLACIDEVWGTKAQNLGSRLSIPENLRFIRYSGTTEDERLRLLYVALTRAKTDLYLTSYVQSYTGRTTTRLKYLEEHTNESDELVSPLLPAGHQTVQFEDETPPEIADLTVYWRHRHYHAIAQPKLQALLAPRLARFQLSPTELNCFTDVTTDGPSTFFTQSLLRFPSAATPAGQYGSAIHETLEWIHLHAKEQGSAPSTQQTLDFFERRLRAKRIVEPQASLLIERGRDTLPIYLAQRAHTIQPDSVTEYGFRGEGVFVGPAHLTGKIDKLLINSQTKTLTIVDYKTGKSYRRWSNEIKLHAYRQQLYFYKLLVERSHTFAGYAVKDAYLEFVEPDEQGRIHELHLTFDPERMARTEQLIEAVWRHIMALNLPAVADYTNDIKGIEQFEQDLIDDHI